MKLKILFEDKNIIAIDKPAGIACHRDARSIDEKTIAELVVEYDKKIEKVGEPMKVEYKGEQIEIKRPGIVHRLDKDTSGVLLIARNQKTFEMLKEQFQNHTIQKVYRCFVYGRVSDPKASLLSGGNGIINAPIGRSPKDIRMWTAGRGAREGVRDAITEYKVLSRFEDGIPLLKKETKDDHYFSYVEVYPKTGRTHQIRVHMRYINHPIVSDPLYSANREKALGMDRLALHACSITFQLSNGETQTVEAPLPKDFKEVVKKYIEIEE